ncbi:hypothetical protein BaRGS_00010081 [Batillaria attramentaria]|uniref:Uncharacterized protein n=1 Tax=Batillaria attramentaria TaxID=370345 RepID=A0ABD0LGJ0_9CAEN
MHRDRPLTASFVRRMGHRHARNTGRMAWVQFLKDKSQQPCASVKKGELVLSGPHFNPYKTFLSLTAPFVLPVLDKRTALNYRLKTQWWVFSLSFSFCGDRVIIETGAR